MRSMRPELAFRPLALAATAALAAFPAGAAAQGAELPAIRVTAETPAERSDGPVQGYRAQRSSTFTKTDTPIEQVPATVTVVPETLMRDAAMQSLADVFRYVPGATWHQGEGNRDQVVLRGISTTADFFVDGVRDDAQVFRDLYNLERVEVLKGPAGMAFGRGGAGGVVNRVTKRPTFERHAQATVTAGSWGQWRGTADVGAAVGERLAWRLNAMAESANSYRDDVTMRRYAINPTLTLVAGPRTIVTFGLEHLDDDRTADRGIPSRDGRPYDTRPGAFFGNAAQSRAQSTVDGFYAYVDHEFERWQLHNALRVTRYDKYYRNVYPDNALASAVSAAGALRLAAYDNANRRTNVFNQTELTRRFTAGATEHQVLVGVELGRQESTSRRRTGFFGAGAGQTLATVSADSPLAVASDFRANGSDADNVVHADVAAAYVQDQWTLAKSLKLIAGLRFDRFETRFDDRRTTVAPVDLARTDSAWSTRLGAIWSPTDTTSLYASYSDAFLPSGEQLSLAPNTADLAPERARNYEVGARWYVRPRLLLSAAVFRLDRDDVRSPDPLNPGFFVKTGQQRTEGAEIGVQGDVTSRWQVFGGFALLDSRITSTTSAAPAGARVPLVPRHALSLWNRFRYDANWSAGLGLVHQGASYAAIDDTVRLPAFDRVDAALYYTFTGGRTRLALNVENLLDRRYYPTADGNNNITPGAPRTLRLTLLTSF